MVAYNQWANERILRTAAGLEPEQFNSIVDTLQHVLGTQRWWYSNWTGGQFEHPNRAALPHLQADFDASHAALEGLASALTDAEWQRQEQWWKEWGEDASASVGQALFQVVMHGIQHRAEVAATLTEHGCSPGDMDYLNFLKETAIVRG
jgi:uncharacterized damage-inducible protein DinB